MILNGHKRYQQKGRGRKLSIRWREVGEKLYISIITAYRHFPPPLLSMVWIGMPVVLCLCVVFVCVGLSLGVGRSESESGSVWVWVWVWVRVRVSVWVGLSQSCLFVIEEEAGLNRKQLDHPLEQPSSREWHQLNSFWHIEISDLSR